MNCERKHFQEARWSCSKIPKRNAIEMSVKCRKRSLSKNEDTKAMRYYEENNYYERLKSPPLFTVPFIINYPIPMFLILGLKFKLKSKL